MRTTKYFKAALWTCWLLCGAALPASSQRMAEAGHGPQQEMVWTHWGGAQYAFADDGEAIWIGATGSVLRWDKATESTRRYGVEHGLRHHSVLATAVDAQGNRWFGGDAGISRLDGAGNWTHLTPQNSDLPQSAVIDIATGEDGSVWLLHGVSGGPVTHLLPDQSMRPYPDRATAVAAAYEQVKGTSNRNRLWTVAGDEVWVDYLVYDGSAWHDRRPFESAAFPEAMDVDSGGVVWALQYRTVYAWDGNAWTEYEAYAPHAFNNSFTSLVVATDDTVWLGGQATGDPYSAATAYLGPLPDQPHPIGEPLYLEAQAPTVALLASSEGIWAMGDNWLLTPHKTLHTVVDAPLRPAVSRALMTTDDAVFIHSNRYEQGTVQTLDDGGTTAYHDDLWNSIASDFWFAELTAADAAPGGDVWVAGYSPGRVDHVVSRPTRLRDGAALAFDLPLSTFDVYIEHIFAQTERLTWFIYNDDEARARGLLALDDGGTPAETGDDIWSHLEIPEFPITLAADGAGRLLAGGDSGLWRREGVAWHLFIEAPEFQNFVLADDGTIFAWNAYPTCTASVVCRDEIRIFRPDGSREIKSIDDLVRDEYHRVLSASRRNSLWAVGAGGVVWYLQHPDPPPAQPVVKRYDGQQATTYALPLQIVRYTPDYYLREPLLVSAENHLYLTLEGRLLRLSPRPTLHLDSQVWLLSPGATRQQAVGAHRVSGHTLPVTLELLGIPDGISATFHSNPVSASEGLWLTLSASEDVAPGVYNATLTAKTGEQSLTAPVSLVVAPAVYDVHAPWWAR